MTKCNLCDSNNINVLTENSTFTYKGENINYDVEYSVCNHCGEEFIDSEQIQSNEIKARAEKKKIDGLLSSVELQGIRVKFDFTQVVASKIYGGGPNAFSKYERGLVSQSAAMDKLIRVSDAVPGVLNWLKDNSGIVETKYTYLKLVDSKPVCVEKKFNEGSFINDNNFTTTEIGSTEELSYG